MNTSLMNSMVGMHSLQQKIDIIANNVANVNTVGYKRKDATFQDILTSYYPQHDEAQLPGRLTPQGLISGASARLTPQLLDMSQGSLMPTDVPTDLAIEGNGLFEISVVRLDDNGQPMVDDDGILVLDQMWTRNGSFQLTTQQGDEDHAYLTTEQGHLITGTNEELIAIPRTHRLLIDSNGIIRIQHESGEDDAEEIGQLKIAQVLRPQMLQSIGNNMFVLPNDLDEAEVNEIIQLVDNPQNAGIAVHQGFLEQSNTDLTQEMVEMLAVQRAYQLNARAIMSSDTMMSLANQLRS